MPIRSSEAPVRPRCFAAYRTRLAASTGKRSARGAEAPPSCSTTRGRLEESSWPADRSGGRGRCPRSTGRILRRGRPDRRAPTAGRGCRRRRPTLDRRAAYALVPNELVRPGRRRKQPVEKERPGVCRPKPWKAPLRVVEGPVVKTIRGATAPTPGSPRARPRGHRCTVDACVGVQQQDVRRRPCPPARVAAVREPPVSSQLDPVSGSPRQPRGSRRARRCRRR